MGVQGLTSFIEKHSHACMEKYELHDTDLVIDGDSTAYQLYSQHFTPKNCCFSGDYDRFGMLIKTFFKTLFDCKIKPIIIFDGGYDDRKMQTIEKRMKERITLGGIIDNTSKDILFPLFLGELFKDIAVEHNLPVIRCDFEGDLESASIAKALNCPVLSNDSDFYIFDVLYIPFSSLKLQPIRNILLDSPIESYSYISCKIYRTDKFVQFMKLSKSMLPLFATLMGNDYVNRKNLTQLFGKSFHDRRQNNFKTGFIEQLANWLKNQRDVDSAKEKVLELIRNGDKEQIKKEIQETINGYICKNSKYLAYINSEIQDEACEIGNDTEGFDKDFLKVFLNNFRKCLYPSCFMNMLIQNTYYIRPQIEDHSVESAHMASIEVISVINQILKNSTEKLRFYTRIQSGLKEQLLPLFLTSVPTYLEIQEFTEKDRKKFLFDILHIKENFVKDCLNNFPSSWKLYILSIKYLCDKTGMNWSIIYAIILCKILLEYVDKQIGFFRNANAFSDKYKQDICKILIDRTTSEAINTPNEISIEAAIEAISYEDSLIAQKNLITFFKMKPELGKTEAFNRRIVHASAQFQSCFYHINFLNSLLKSPFKNCPISNCFNGTFIYNMTSDLRNKHDENYVHFLLQNAPSVLKCFSTMINNLKQHVHVSFLPTNHKFDV